MKKRIDTTKEMRQKAMKVFHVTEQTVFNAICFGSKRGDTDKAKRIRSYIVQNGGAVRMWISLADSGAGLGREEG